MFFVFTGYVTAQPVVHIDAGSHAEGSMQVYVGVIGSARKTDACKLFTDNLKRCLEYGGKFALTIKQLNAVPSKKSAIQKLFKKNYDCALFITFDGPSKSIEWRLYDTHPGTMIRGKRHQPKGNDMRSAAYAIATVIMYELTAEHPPFLTKIAYRKRDNKRKICMLCITDFDGTSEEVLFHSRRMIVAPAWNKDPYYPSVLFSEFTPSNVRLMACDMKGRKQIVLDVDGTTVGVSYAPWSDEVVYCRSGAIWRYHYDQKHKKGIHKIVIRESSPCVSPTLLNSGDIIYCCRGKIKHYHSKTGKQTILDSKGYSVGPAYSSQAQKVIYSKRIGKYMQLFLHDIRSGKDLPLTFESNIVNNKDYRSEKTDACWSPCGSYCAFCWKRDGVSRIALINVMTGQYQFITEGKDHCSYPAWSPNYDIFPCVS